MLAHQGTQGVREENRLDDLQWDLVVEEDGDEDEVDGDADVPGVGVAELEGDPDLPDHDEGGDSHAVHKIPGGGQGFVYFRENFYWVNNSVFLFVVATYLSLFSNQFT